MTETQLLILANVILFGLVPLEWLYYAWRDRENRQQESNVSQAHLSANAADELSPEKGASSVESLYQHFSESVATSRAAIQK